MTRLGCSNNPLLQQTESRGVVVRLPPGHYCLFPRGVLELLTMNQGQHADSRIEGNRQGYLSREHLRTMVFNADQTLRTIALCYWSFGLWPLVGTHFHSVDVEFPTRTGDRVLTVLPIATQCGTHTAGTPPAVLFFCTLDPHEGTEAVQHARVLTWRSPEDKTH